MSILPGIGMDTCVIPLRHGGLSLVQTTDYIYPIVDDPYMMVSLCFFVIGTALCFSFGFGWLYVCLWVWVLCLAVVFFHFCCIHVILPVPDSCSCGRLTCLFSLDMAWAKWCGERDLSTVFLVCAEPHLLFWEDTKGWWWCLLSFLVPISLMFVKFTAPGCFWLYFIITLILNVSSHTVEELEDLITIGLPVRQGFSV